MVRSCHESYIPLRVGHSVPMLVEVGKHPFAPIKGKKMTFIQLEGIKLVHT